MSIFGDIMSAIFGKSAEAAPQAQATPTPSAAPAPSPSATPAASVPAAAARPAPLSKVDVAAVMDGLAKKSKQKLHWRTSIVDLMKLLDLDSGLQARTALAKELHYTGDVKNTATMNVWLHKQVMTKLAENGGQVPSELKH
jgi:hypothetical protein